MATITATVRATGNTTQVDVSLQSVTVIVDPAAYVGTAAVSAEVLARAGLSATLEFQGAVLQSSTSLGGIYYYELISTYGELPSGVTTHTHDHTTLTFPSLQAYLDGPETVLSSTLGPVLISYGDDTTVDYLRVQTDTDTTTRDLFWIRQGSIVRVGAHQEFFADATYDIGTPDAGVTLRRPRDIRIGQDLWAGRNLEITGYGSFDSYVIDTHHRFTSQASNPDNTAATRHVYVNSGDNSLRFWDGGSDVIISGGVGTSGDTVGLYSCPAGVAVGDAVVLSGAGNVVKANATTLGNNTIAGIVVLKPTPTTASVKYIGETGAVFGGGLTAGNQYYLARTDGGITDTLAGFLTGDVELPVGFAKDTDILVIRIGEPFVR